MTGVCVSVKITHNMHYIREMCCKMYILIIAKYKYCLLGEILMKMLMNFYED